ncbi:MAG: hypothetical protein QM704_19535 [Anaeromyxobacteraceae bacterium]
MGTGWDHGFSQIAEVRFTNGATSTLEANGGYTTYAGASFLPALDGRLATRVTAGFKYDAIRARNGSVSYRAFPLEVSERLDLGPLRLGLGASLVVGPRLSGRLDSQSAHQDLRTSLGLVGRLACAFPCPSGACELELGARGVLQRFQASSGGPATDANAIGLYAEVHLGGGRKP